MELRPSEDRPGDVPNKKKPQRGAEAKEQGESCPRGNSDGEAYANRSLLRCGISIQSMSALCQKRTHAPQQKNSQSLIGAAERARDFAERDLWNVRLHQSALAPENLTTLAHFSTS